ncbi:hypothetical protein JG688_00017356 [Phytophthora aleatoria]|uniref:Uncharacterized protein n=1 Tax=Phytophthora aleatoria TaxID=2496075 RepID=A0A8J5ICL8_9STRA|nr:hypothetical protein JG688_00017356 [Phytophthora aleatoria]
MTTREWRSHRRPRSLWGETPTTLAISKVVSTTKRLKSVAVSHPHQFSRQFCTTSCNRARQNLQGPRLRTAPQRVPPNVVGVSVNTATQSSEKTIMKSLSGYSSSFRQITAYQTVYRKLSTRRLLIFLNRACAGGSSEAKSNGANTG